MSNVSSPGVRDSDGDGEPDMAEDSRALQTHEGDTTNPHSVTSNQTGAAQDLANHETTADAHHSPPSFGTESSTFSAGYGTRGTIQVSFSTTYKTAGLSAGLVGSGSNSDDRVQAAGFDSWVTDASGNITGANIYVWNGGAYTSTYGYQVFGVSV